MFNEVDVGIFYFFVIKFYGIWCYYDFVRIDLRNILEVIYFLCLFISKLVFFLVLFFIVYCLEMRFLRFFFLVLLKEEIIIGVFRD